MSSQDLPSIDISAIEKKGIIKILSIETSEMGSQPESKTS